MYKVLTYLFYNFILPLLQGFMVMGAVPPPNFYLHNNPMRFVRLRECDRPNVI